MSNNLEAYKDPTIVYPRLKGAATTMMIVSELEEFAAAIRENREPSVTLADGRRVLKILDAVIESGKTKKPVNLS